MMSPIEEARRVLAVEADALRRVGERLGESFGRAVDAVLTCRGRVVVIGMGKSGIVGRKIAATLASIGSPALFVHAAEGGHGDIGMLARGDCAIAISRSGETAEVLAVLPALKRLEVPLIALTGKADSTLAREAGVVLDVSVEEEACDMDLVPTASTTATMALGDALAVCVLKRRGLTPEDYATFHPAGSLGRRLLLRVGDIMRSGGDMSSVRTGTFLRDAILVMTEKKMGAACVVDGRGRLAGVVTDHDLRKALAGEGIDLAAVRVEEVMTASPMSVSRDLLVASAVALTERRRVSVLPVVAADGTLEGMVHLHDLIRSGAG